MSGVLTEVDLWASAGVGVLSHAELDVTFLSSSALSSAVLVVAQTAMLELGEPVTVNPFTTVPVVATVTAGQFDQILFTSTGYPVSLTVVGGVQVSYRAPATMTGATVIVTATGKKTGQPDVVVSRVDTVNPHAGLFMKINGIDTGLEFRGFGS